MKMVLKKLEDTFTVFRVREMEEIDMSAGYLFIGRTDEEISCVCPCRYVPHDVLMREDGWRGFRIEGVLDFSLTGILSGILSVLAENRIGIFAVSTFNTDYVFVKEENYDRALSVLEEHGYEIK